MEKCTGKRCKKLKGCLGQLLSATNRTAEVRKEIKFIILIVDLKWLLNALTFFSTEPWEGLFFLSNVDLLTTQRNSSMNLSDTKTTKTLKMAAATRAIAYHPAYLNDGSLKQIHRILLTFLHRDNETLNNTGTHGYEVFNRSKLCYVFS